MTINEYQELAMKTLNPELSPRDVLINGVMGLCGESGEAIESAPHPSQKFFVRVPFEVKAGDIMRSGEN